VIEHPAVSALDAAADAGAADRPISRYRRDLEH
jgi:hypothetical protein